MNSSTDVCDSKSKQTFSKEFLKNNLHTDSERKESIKDRLLNDLIQKLSRIRNLEHREHFHRDQKVKLKIKKNCFQKHFFKKSRN